MSDLKKALPELLSPAGSPEALDAAIEGGADAVYLGASAFNARMYATNFGGDDLRSAVLRAHCFGVKVYLTLNTLVTDRELPLYLQTAREAYEAGVDALIVADLGGAAAIHRLYPEIELHASTQMSGHNASMGQVLKQLGFSRMVVARETSLKDLQKTVANAPLEIEAFVHGALCVSHSGQCLFSSLVGGRSGNRGECAQPCRLPYACAGKQGYPLSLKDLSLAAHVPALIECGVASLKIEGRMKSPEYVRDTTRIFRRLLDERRAASPEELRELADVFSRGGFTDGYFTGRIDQKMLGVRSREDKQSSRAVLPFTGLQKKLPLALSASIRADRPVRLTLSDGNRSVTVTGEIPAAAINAPLNEETVKRNLSKLGGTHFYADTLELTLEPNLMLPISKLNELRRSALAAWNDAVSPVRALQASNESAPVLTGRKERLLTARFQSREQIPPAAFDYFDRVYLPLQNHAKGIAGVVLPPVVFEGDLPRLDAMLQAAAQNGATHALVGNLGHLDAVKRAGLIPVGDFRLNLTNRESVASIEALGVKEALLSPELTLPQIRDIDGSVGVIVYGRLPLMTLEKCIGKELADCNACNRGAVVLKDRRGASFPVLREWEHRSVIYNSLCTSMSDRQAELERNGVWSRHFLFTTEKPQEVLNVLRAHEQNAPLPQAVRRLK